MKDDHIVLDYAAPVKVQAFPQCFRRLLPFAGNRRADFFDSFFSNVFAVSLPSINLPGLFLEDARDLTITLLKIAEDRLQTTPYESHRQGSEQPESLCFTSHVAEHPKQPPEPLGPRCPARSGGRGGQARPREGPDGAERISSRPAYC